MIKKELRSLLSDGKANQVLAELRRLTADNSDLHNEVLQISAQFAENERIRRLNIADPKDVRIEYNRINSVIIIIIDRLPDDLERKKVKPKWENFALWVGILAAVAGFTGYTLKDFFDSKNDNTQVHKEETEQQNSHLQTSDPTNTNSNVSKIEKGRNQASNTYPKQEVDENKITKKESPTEGNKPINTPNNSNSDPKPQDDGLLMRIVEAGTEKPIDGVFVQLTNSNAIIQTDKNGCFIVSRTIIDQYGMYNSIRAYFTKNGYESTKFEIPLSQPTSFKLKKVR